MSALALPPEEILARVAAGDVDGFFRSLWRRRPHHAPGAFADWARCLDPRALHDVLAAQPLPWALLRRGPQGVETRAGVPLAEAWKAVEDGAVLRLNLGAAADPEGLPAPLRALRRTHDALRRQLGEECVIPGSAAVCTLFLSGPGSSIGAHYDNGDVFAFGLGGTKRWRVDADPDLPRAVAAAARGEVIEDLEMRDVWLAAGDALYLPPYCRHEVTGQDLSLGVTFGFAALNPAHLLARRLGALLGSRQKLLAPLTFPPPSHAESADRAACDQRVRELLDEIRREI